MQCHREVARQRQPPRPHRNKVLSAQQQQPLTSTAAKAPPTSASVVPYCAIWLPVRTRAGQAVGTCRWGAEQTWVSASAAEGTHRAGDPARLSYHATQHLPLLNFRSFAATPSSQHSKQLALMSPQLDAAAPVSAPAYRQRAIGRAGELGGTAAAPATECCCTAHSCSAPAGSRHSRWAGSRSAAAAPPPQL